MILLFLMTLATVQAQVAPPETLSPPIGFAQHRQFLKSCGLSPNTTYEVELFRPHPYEIPGMLLNLKLESTSDKFGCLTPGAEFVAKYLATKGISRKLTDIEISFADEILAKTMPDTLMSLLDSGISSILEAEFTPHRDVLIIKISHTGQTVKLAMQDLNVIDPDVMASMKPLNPKPIAQGGNQLDGFSVFPKDIGTPVPAVVVVGGSGGTIPKGWAFAFAQNGIAAVGIRYFSYDSNDPAVLSGAITHLIKKTPLELFKRAIEFARDLPNVEKTKVSFLGESRGGEAAYLFAQYYGNEVQLNSVIANRPLHFSVGSKISESYQPEPDESSWTFRGVDIPFAKLEDSTMQFPETIRLNRAQGTLDSIKWWQPEGEIDLPLVTLRPFFEEMHPPKDAYVNLADFNGRVLALAGTNDLLWPADEAVRFVAKQRPNRIDDFFFNIVGGGHYIQVGRASNNIKGEYVFEIGKKGLEAQNQRVIARDGGIDRVIDGIHELLNEYLVIQAIKNDSNLRFANILPFKEFIEEN